MFSLLHADRDAFKREIEARLADGWAPFFFALDVLKDQDVCQMAVALLVMSKQSRERPSEDIRKRLQTAAKHVAAHAKLRSASRRLKFLDEAVAEASSAGWGWASPAPLVGGCNKQASEGSALVPVSGGQSKQASGESWDRGRHSETTPDRARAFRMPWKERAREFNIDGREFNITQFPKEKCEAESEDGHIPQAERTGMVVWNSAVVLSFAVRKWIVDSKRRRAHAPRILELGAGLGLPGLVAAATIDECNNNDRNNSAGAASTPDRGAIILTDLPLVVDTLRRNVSSAMATLGLAADAVSVEAFMWGDHERLGELVGSQGADVVLCADCVYFAKSHECLLQTFAELIRLNPSVVILMCQKRRNQRTEDEFFLKKLPAAGLQCEAVELPSGVTRNQAAMTVLGYEDPLAFVGIDLVSICAA